MAVSPAPSSTGCVPTALLLSLCVSVPFAENNIQSYENTAPQSKKLPGNPGQVQYACKHSQLLMKGLDCRLKHCCNPAAGDINTNRTLTQSHACSPRLYLPKCCPACGCFPGSRSSARRSPSHPQLSPDMKHMRAPKLNQSHGVLLLHLPQ